MITLGIPTLSRYDMLEKLLLSAEAGTVKPDRYAIIDNGGGYSDSPLVQAFADKITIYDYGANIGVAASWNHLIRNEQELLIICNDDITLLPNTIEFLHTYVEDHPDYGFITGETTNHQNLWSMFVHRRWLFDRIGPYDENLWPAYYEDNDMGRRIELAGYQLYQAQGAFYDHFGSATMKAYSPDELNLHHERFRANQNYYINKWGGLPHHETFNTPFDMGL